MICVLSPQSCPALYNPWTIAWQAPLSMEFSRQEYWNRLPFPPPGDLPNLGTKLMSSASPASFNCILQLSQYHLMKRPFPIVYSCLLCQRLVDCRCVGLFLGSLFCYVDPHQLLFEYHTVLINVALSHCLKSGRLMPHALFFFFRVALAILGFLWLYIDSRIVLCCT